MSRIYLSRRLISDSRRLSMIKVSRIYLSRYSKINLKKLLNDTLYYRVYISNHNDEEDRIRKKDAIYRFTFAIYDDIYLIMMSQVIT